MSLHKFNPIVFYSPDDAGGNAGEELSANKILDILNEPDEPVEEIELKSKKEPKDAEGKSDDSDDSDSDKSDKSDEVEEDSLEELEDELKEPGDEDLELIEMPRRKEILAKYPKLFSEFPGLEKAFYRERQYTELFPTLQDARAAGEKSQILDQFEGKLLGGDVTAVLRAIKDESTEKGLESFNKIVDNYLPSLRTVDESAYFHVLSTVVKGTIYNMVKEGQELDNAELQQAAQVLNQFVFGSSKWTPATKLAKETSENNPKDHELNRKEQEFQNKQFQTAQADLNTKTGRVLENAIKKHIDPKGAMTDYVKKTAVRDAQENLLKHLENDSRFRAVLDKAWKQAFSRNFDSESMDRVERVIKSRASTVLPAVIKKARNEALRGLGKRANDDDTDDKDTGSAPTSSKGPLRKEASNSSNSGNRGTVKGKIPAGMSNRDFIMAD